jgi:nitroimidazol reductase NimA-like FMN-containing flavoprotein (pyridoxamine 5'-phosphate oxidase superfamily)
MTDTAHSFDVDTVLAEPNPIIVATNGPSVRPMWYQWEDGSFWVISGPWAKLFSRIQTDPTLALLIDIEERHKGRIYQVMVRGNAEITPYDIPRARRMLHRYLGPDESAWSTAPDDYPGYLREPGPPGAVWLKIEPTSLRTFNFSYATGPYAAGALQT